MLINMKHSDAVLKTFQDYIRINEVLNIYNVFFKYDFTQQVAITVKVKKPPTYFLKNIIMDAILKWKKRQTSNRKSRCLQGLASLPHLERI